jgi:uncharacterized protein (DUF58 family)
MARLLRVARRLRRRFYDGPAAFNYPARAIRGYRSPNVLIGQWLHAFVVVHFSLAGGMLFAAMILVTLGGLTSLLMPMFLLTVTLWSLFVVDVVLGWLLRPRVVVTRHAPGSCMAGAMVTLVYRVENATGRAAWRVDIDNLPMPLGFRGEEPAPALAAIPAGAVQTLSRRVRLTRRGACHLPLPRADSAFPFGLWRWGSWGVATPPIIVHPSYTPLAAIQFGGPPQVHASAATSTSRLGGSMEFMSTREYQPGDNPRFIDARSWARLNVPVVKEFAEEAAGRVALFLDCFPWPPGLLATVRRQPDPVFEAGVSLTAAAVDYLSRRRFTTHLFFHVVEQTQPELRSLDEVPAVDILDSLATVAATGTAALPALPPADLGRMAAADTVVLILMGWDDRRARLVAALQSAGAHIKVICIVDGPDSTQPPDVVTVSAAAINAGEVLTL